jgi:hypothetical protein
MVKFSSLLVLGEDKEFEGIVFKAFFLASFKCIFNCFLRNCGEFSHIVSSFECQLRQKAVNEIQKRVERGEKRENECTQKKGWDGLLRYCNDGVKVSMAISLFQNQE